MKSAFAVAALHSGAGKTTITLSILAALRKRGYAVQPFKTGPDFIDPMHHEIITGRPSHNLDTWMIPEVENRRIFAAACADADIAALEGVMGLFDGVDGKRPDGSTEHLARTLGLPVLLIVDARSMARSAAAIVKGAVDFVPELKIAGIIWNRVGSPSHRRILDEAVASAIGLPPVLGSFHRHEGISLGERHLGLVTPDDSDLPSDWADKLAALAEEAVDLDGLIRLTAAETPPLGPKPPRPATRRKIAVARDAAYCFYYQRNLEIIRELGGETVFFSPLEGDAIPRECDALYLGGGYPELHAERISANAAFIDGIRRLYAENAPIYGECGGFMTLCRSVDAGNGIKVPMADIFPADAVMGNRLNRLGYRELTGRPGSPVEGMAARGHEFHYSSISEMPESVARIYDVKNSRGEGLKAEGYRLGNTTGGYMHLHFSSNREFIAKLLGLS